MKINLFLNVLLLVSSVVIYAEEAKYKIYIAQDIGNQNQSFIFFLDGNNHDDVDVAQFFKSGNNVTSKGSANDKIFNARLLGGPVLHFTKKPNTVLFWRRSYPNPILEQLYIEESKIPNSNFAFGRSCLEELTWSVFLDKEYYEKIYFFNEMVYKEDENPTAILSSKNIIDFQIAKLLDKKLLSFALIISNNTETEAKVPAFHTGSSQIKLKFPDGKIYEHPINSKGKESILKSGGNKYIVFDLEALLKESDDFSMNNFNYGLSELIWEIKLPDGKVITKNFWLVKFNGELPADSPYGYCLEGSVMDMKSFKNNKVTPLPLPERYKEFMNNSKPVDTAPNKTPSLNFDLNDEKIDYQSIFE